MRESRGMEIRTRLHSVYMSLQVVACTPCQYIPDGTWNLVRCRPHIRRSVLDSELAKLERNMAFNPLQLAKQANKLHGAMMSAATYRSKYLFSTP